MKIIYWLSFITFLTSCGPEFSKKGEKELNEIQKQYSCVSISRGYGTKYNRNKKVKPKNYIVVSFTNCNGKLNVNSISRYFDLTKEIAEKLYFECTEKEKYDGIQISYHLSSDEIYNKTYLFMLNKETNTLALIDSTGILPKK